MKFPSILKIPRHQRFQFKPRYYDPVKDDLDQRISKIRQELNHNKKGKSGLSNNSRIRGAFSGRAIGHRRTGSKSGILQFSIMIILFGSFFGYLYYGEIALYALLLIIVLYFYLRVRKIF